MKVGLVYIYIYFFFGEIWVFIIGWNMILEYVIGIVLFGRVSSEYIDFIVGGVIWKFFIDNIGQFNVIGLGIYLDFLVFVFVFVVFLIVVSGVKYFVVFNKIVMIVNMLVILFIFVVGLFYVNLVNWVGVYQFLFYGVLGVLVGVVSCFYCFVGFDVIVIVSEEIINFKRVIFFFIMLCFVISFFVYFGVVVILILMVFYDKLDKFVLLLEVFKLVGVFVVKYVIVVGGFCVLVGFFMSGIFVVF